LRQCVHYEEIKYQPIVARTIKEVKEKFEVCENYYYLISVVGDHEYAASEMGIKTPCYIRMTLNLYLSPGRHPNQLESPLPDPDPGKADLNSSILHRPSFFVAPERLVEECESMIGTAQPKPTSATASH